MTPKQEAAANEAANKVLAELRAASTPAECAAVAEKHAKVFERLESVHPVRAIHIMNLAALKRKEFEMIQRAENKAQADLFA